MTDFGTRRDIPDDWVKVVVMVQVSSEIEVGLSTTAVPDDPGERALTPLRQSWTPHLSSNPSICYETEERKRPFDAHSRRVLRSSDR
jgi:hypothetical protein